MSLIEVGGQGEKDPYVIKELRASVCSESVLSTASR